MKKQSIILSSALATLLTSGVAVAELTANGAVANNYIWRGVTQTADTAAVSAGVDWSGDQGLYVGGWVSNLGPGAGQELDLYAGMVLDMGDNQLDVGVISYRYPVAATTSFTEVYAKANIDIITAEAYLTVLGGSANAAGAGDTGDIYLTASANLEPFTVYAGTYMISNSGGTDYIHYGANMTIEDLTFSVDKNDIGGNVGHMRFTVSYSKGWEL